METISKRRVPGPKLNIKNGFIDLSHGSGGRAMMQLINEIFCLHSIIPYSHKNDQACFAVESGRMVMSTDAHVISPLFFQVGISVLYLCMERSMILLWQARNPCIYPQVLFWRKAFLLLT